MAESGRVLARLLVVVAILGVIGIGSAAMAGWRAVHRPLNLPIEGVWLEVEPGRSLSAVSRELAERGLVTSPRLLSLFGRFRGDATNIQAGEYLLEGDMSAASVLDRLVAGDVYLHQLTIIEGWRFSDLLHAVRAHPAISASSTTADDIMSQLGSPGVHPEGQFAPDTYSFPRGTSDIEILGQAHRAMIEQLNAVWANRSPTAAVDTTYEALILASIIEKETALASERPQISGVFSRRLQRGMRLQTDPTVIYGLGEAFDGNLRRADLNRDTPYNTYTRRGLPPTPIALPGLASLQAAVDPYDGGYLYFVATGEPDGSHDFSATLEEHNQAVARYLRRLRARDAE